MIIDNVAIHKANDVEAVARKYQIRLAYLPTYSPDLNPIFIV
ncbi:transposase [Acinetobacter guillouiae]